MAGTILVRDRSDRGFDLSGTCKFYCRIELTAAVFCVSNITEVSQLGNPVINITKVVVDFGGDFLGETRMGVGNGS
ncbi:hypothetical protein [Roseibium salinum]|uniref:Uncharacterized protein n=1 Tax=Roseibium salinum TaxID=1604349 RepID=A0ABT3R885_9HYPH|nr:hypothetical protein [Roseibium sp. DSM 29163]MCX2725526.1 hypothetical protein [Roseibium sp. DSM 29163]